MGTRRTPHCMSPRIAASARTCPLSLGTCLTNCVIMGLVVVAADIVLGRLRANLLPLPDGPLVGGASFPPALLCPSMSVIVWLNVVFWATLVGTLYLAAFLLPDRIRPRAWVCTSCTLLIFFSMLLNCEFELRISACDKVATFPYWPDATLYWTFNPAADSPILFQRTGSITAAGFRGLEVSPQKEAGEFRILCLGDSITACTELRDRETYPEQLRSYLQKAFPKLHIVVQNGGVPGYSILQGALVLERLLPTFQPDLVIVGHIHCKLETLDAEGRIPASHRFPLTEIRSALFSSYLFLFLKQEIAGTPQVGLGLSNQKVQPLPPPAVQEVEAAYFRATLESLIASAHTHGFKLVLLRPCMTLPVNRVALVTGTVARENHVPFVDLKALWSQRTDLATLLPDRMHMNARAAQLAARDIGQFLIDQGLLSERPVQQVQGAVADLRRRAGRARAGRRRCEHSLWRAPPWKGPHESRLPP